MTTSIQTNGKDLFFEGDRNEKQVHFMIIILMTNDSLIWQAFCFLSSLKVWSQSVNSSVYSSICKQNSNASHKNILQNTGPRRFTNTVVKSGKCRFVSTLKHNVQHWISKFRPFVLRDWTVRKFWVQKMRSIGRASTLTAKLMKHHLILGNNRSE